MGKGWRFAGPSAFSGLGFGDCVMGIDAAPDNAG
jgi:hypothetical protein